MFVGCGDPFGRSLTAVRRDDALPYPEISFGIHLSASPVARNSACLLHASRKPKENEVPEMWLEEDEGWRVGGEAPHPPPFFFFLGVAGE